MTTRPKATTTRRRRPATLADLRAGRASKRDQAKFRAIMRKVIVPALREVAAESQAWQAEALRLYELLQDADLRVVRKGSAAHAVIAANPPSVGAIAMLILLAEDRLRALLAEQRRQQAAAAAKAKHATTAARLAAARAEFTQSADLQAMKVPSAAAVLGPKHNLGDDTVRKHIATWRRAAGIRRR